MIYTVKKIHKIKSAGHFIALFMFTAILIFTLSACGEGSPVVESETTGAEAVIETTAGETEEKTEETTAAETESPSEETTAAETEESEEQEVIAQTGFFDPLTGLPTTEELASKRPVAIMINNYSKALPQLGIRYADVLYECLAEGGITRLVMLKTDYENLPVIGSVRSSRDYYIDFAQNHNAIYVHAGGSSYAYSAIKERGINNLDGVNMYLPTTFYRDNDRIYANGYEHSLMTTGEGIVDGINYKNYDTVQPEGFEGPFEFVEYGTENELSDGMDAKHIVITYTGSQFPQYIYNPETKTYLRYQFKGEKHIDGETGEQLEFTNLIILVCKHTNLNDEAGRIAVGTTGSGAGYYITHGKYIPITWEKADAATPVTLKDTLGNEIELNCGKTMINVISPEVERTLVLDHKS